ncbi:hypothetical protein [Blastomonas fulva]|uniref:hypothetical protein n=1 Tax=Blastomonas fulva TaxID=1550728 RepID=UPI0025A3900E|nr:hypothetical protein [Blastomonas fulva]MDM7927765.1 hypothetical protein [Blastomonas fulva]MDM7967954.1 hypothetical protein [Blastomonas fulva]
MTPAQRTTVSFLDLALIMTGVMAMIASVGDRHPAVAEALADSFGSSAPVSAERVTLKLARLFEPQEARLTDQGVADITALGVRARPAKSKTVEIGIIVPVVAEKGASRLDRWELAAARTAAIMRVLADQGVADSAMVPDLARPGTGSAGSERDVTLTLRATAPRQ